MTRTYKNIVFDLGNVLLRIDVSLSEFAFAQHGLNNFSYLYSLAKQTELFDKLEVGQISEDEFYSELRHLSNTNLSNDTIKTCWNALIIGFFPQRIQVLKKLKNEYRIFILSNTNIIHYQHYTNMLKEQGLGLSLESLVDKAYFSHEIKMRKPNKDIFNYLVQDAQIQASETLFVDDSKVNILSAAEMGFKTLFLENL